jgi:hypothetical protein
MSRFPIKSFGAKKYNQHILIQEVDMRLFNSFCISRLRANGVGIGFTVRFLDLSCFPKSSVYVIKRLEEIINFATDCVGVMVRKRRVDVSGGGCIIRAELPGVRVEIGPLSAPFHVRYLKTIITPRRIPQSIEGLTSLIGKNAARADSLALMTLSLAKKFCSGLDGLAVRGIRDEVRLMMYSAMLNQASALTQLAALSARGRVALLELAAARGDVDAICDRVEHSSGELRREWVMQAGRSGLVHLLMLDSLIRGRAEVERLVNVGHRLGMMQMHIFELLPQICDMIAADNREAAQLAQSLSGDDVVAFIQKNKGKGIEWEYWGSDVSDTSVVTRAADAGMAMGQCEKGVVMWREGQRPAGLALIRRAINSSPHLVGWTCWKMSGAGAERIPRDILLAGVRARHAVSIDLLANELRVRQPERARRLYIRAERAGLDWGIVRSAAILRSDPRTTLRMARPWCLDADDDAAAFLANLPAFSPSARCCYRLLALLHRMARDGH